jgi:hypothetical protein
MAETTPSIADTGEKLSASPIGRAAAYPHQIDQDFHQGDLTESSDAGKQTNKTDAMEENLEEETELDFSEVAEHEDDVLLPVVSRLTANPKARGETPFTNRLIEDGKSTQIESHITGSVAGDHTSKHAEVKAMSELGSTEGAQNLLKSPDPTTGETEVAFPKLASPIFETPPMSPAKDGRGRRQTANGENGKRTYEEFKCDPGTPASLGFNRASSILSQSDVSMSPRVRRMEYARKRQAKQQALEKAKAEAEALRKKLAEIEARDAEAAAREEAEVSR